MTRAIAVLLLTAIWTFSFGFIAGLITAARADSSAVHETIATDIPASDTRSWFRRNYGTRFDTPIEPRMRVTDNGRAYLDP